MTGPFVVLVGQHSDDETERAAVGKDADDVCGLGHSPGAHVLDSALIPKTSTGWR
ncbi:MAG: hypothetical protein JO330_04200 [Mycobacteriaceae bacterium]|nr:hypothetical protein [Mycobacteriaceae bacterium]